MKKTILSAIICTALTTVATTSSAAESNNTKKLNPWTQCGIGAMIFKETPVAAVISNIIWDLGTTAVTSNMSSKETCEGAGAKTAMFIQATMPQLEKEIAVGEGEYISAMLELRGCKAEEHAPMIKAIRQDYAVKPAKNAKEFYNALETRVETSFSSSCVGA